MVLWKYPGIYIFIWDVQYVQNLIIHLIYVYSFEGHLNYEIIQNYICNVQQLHIKDK